MATAGYKAGFYVSEDDVTYIEVDGIKSLSATNERESLDTTDFKTTGIDRESIMGLRNAPISASGDRVIGDAGQDLIEDLMFSTDDNPVLYIKILLDGTNGYKGRFNCTQFEVASEVEGLTTLSMSFNQNGAYTRVP
jgi:predicted secreted protein